VLADNNNYNNNNNNNNNQKANKTPTNSTKPQLNITQYSEILKIFFFNFFYFSYLHFIFYFIFFYTSDIIKRSKKNIFFYSTF